VIFQGVVLDDDGLRLSGKAAAEMDAQIEASPIYPYLPEAPPPCVHFGQLACTSDEFKNGGKVFQTLLQTTRRDPSGVTHKVKNFDVKYFADLVSKRFPSYLAVNAVCGYGDCTLQSAEDVISASSEEMRAKTTGVTQATKFAAAVWNKLKARTS